jgi:hypothetical protein
LDLPPGCVSQSHDRTAQRGLDLANDADGKLTSEHCEVWSLDGGMLSIAVTDHVVGKAQTATTLAYRRQQ